MASKIMDTQTGVGASSISLQVAPFGTHTVFCKVTSGSLTTAPKVSIQGSLDGTNFADLVSHTFTSTEISDLACVFHAKDRPVKFVRAKVNSSGDDPAAVYDMWYELIRTGGA